MGNTIMTNDQVVTFVGVSTVPAGTSVSNTRVDSDRAVELSNGSHVGRITINVGLTSINDEGYIEVVVFKVQRSAVTPVKGTFPIPSDTDVINAGLQQTYRNNMPGWVIQYRQIPISAQTPKTFVLKIDFKKFKMGTVRDGDFYGITYFNRSGGSVILDWQARYSEWK